LHSQEVNHGPLGPSASALTTTPLSLGSLASCYYYDTTIAFMFLITSEVEHDFCYGTDSSELM